MNSAKNLVNIEFKVLLVLVTNHISSVASQNYSSALFVASKALSTSNWELFKTDSQPSSDLIQCLARCELHPEYTRKIQRNSSLSFSSEGAMPSPMNPTYVKRQTWCN